MKRIGVVVTVVVVAGLVACGGGKERGSESAPAPADTGGEAAAEAPGPSASGAPAVEGEYQSDIDEAWGEATRGEDPSATCAAVKGEASAGEPGSASKALQACNVDIPVRYFMTRLDRAESGDETCMDVVMSILTKLPAMTISVGSSENRSAESRAAVEARLQRRVTEVCPDQADMLQG